MRRKHVLKLMDMLGLENISEGSEWIRASCPFAPWRHTRGADSRPSFGIRVGASSHYYCFSCKAASNLPLLVSSLSMLRGEDMVEARKYVADHEDFALDPYEREDTDEPISIMSEGVLDQFAEAHPGLEIIQKRRITQEAVEHFGLMWDLREARLIFPIRNESGRLVGVRGRASEQTRSKIKYREYSELSSGGSLKANGIWFGMQFRPEDGQKLILVEGELDAVKLWQAIRRPVWAAMGSSIHRAQIARVQALSKPVLLFFDADDAGREASSKLARKLKNVLGAGVFEVTKYGASKDPAELVDAGSLRQALKSIKQVT